MTRCRVLFGFVCAFGVSIHAPAETNKTLTGTLAYILQADRFARTRAGVVRKLAACGRDVIVMDTTFDGQSANHWTRTEIKAIRAGKAGRVVLAYLSIGEAENYRAYWQPEWDADQDGRPDPGAPDFLLEENPDWPGNYRVRYWHPDWQALVLNELDQILRRGFDGVYLDIVDAFEGFEYDSDSGDWIENRLNPETGRSYRWDMVAWVRTVAAHARARRPTFRVVPQNGSPLLRFKAYRNAIDGIGIEDLFTEGNRIQPSDHTDPILEDLDRLRPLGKPVWVIEYATKAVPRQRALDQCQAAGFFLLLTDRELTTLGVAVSPDSP